ncbi:MAG: hypothetical protein EOP61_33100, partial [Sphingomonadales bacterium]
LHVLAVLMWIGGVAFVTLVVMPSLTASTAAEDRLARFHEIEGRFAWQARLWVLLAGASGFWMVWRTELWSRFTDLHYWWMHAMLGIWAIFAVMLFVAEPLVIHRRMATSQTPAADFTRMVWMHRILLLLSLLTLLGAVGGSHGMWF